MTRHNIFTEYLAVIPQNCLSPAYGNHAFKATTIGTCVHHGQIWSWWEIHESFMIIEHYHDVKISNYQSGYGRAKMCLHINR